MLCVHNRFCKRRFRVNARRTSTELHDWFPLCRKACPQRFLEIRLEGRRAADSEYPEMRACVRYVSTSVGWKQSCKSLGRLHRP